MTIEELVTRYDSLSRENQIYFLGWLARDLTVSIRGWYSREPQIVCTDPDSPVGRLNEAQRVLTGFLVDVVQDINRRISGRDIARFTTLITDKRIVSDGWLQWTETGMRLAELGE